MSLCPEFVAAPAVISVSWLTGYAQGYKGEEKDPKGCLVCSHWRGRIMYDSVFRESCFLVITSVTIPFLAAAHVTAEKQLM